MQTEPVGSSRGGFESCYGNSILMGKELQYLDQKEWPLQQQAHRRKACEQSGKSVEKSIEIETGDGNAYAAQRHRLSLHVDVPMFPHRVGDS